MLTGGALSQFFIAALTNYSKFSSLNNANLPSYSSVGQSHWAKIKGYVLEALRENLSLAFSSFQRLPTFLSLWPPSRFFKTSSSELSLPHLISLSTCFSDSDLCQERFFKDSCDQIGPIWIVQETLLILGSLTLTTLAKFPFPCKVRYSQTSRIRTWTPLTEEDGGWDNWMP